MGRGSEKMKVKSENLRMQSFGIWRLIELVDNLGLAGLE